MSQLTIHRKLDFFSVLLPFKVCINNSEISMWPNGKEVIDFSESELTVKVHCSLLESERNFVIGDLASEKRIELSHSWWLNALSLAGLMSIFFSMAMDDRSYWLVPFWILIAIFTLIAAFPKKVFRIDLKTNKRE